MGKSKINNLIKSYDTYVEMETNPVDIKTYSKIAAEYLKFLCLKVLSGYEVTLPQRMGTLCIVGRKPRIKVTENGIEGLAPDWKKTLELWNSDPEAKAAGKKVFYTNANSDGYRYAFKWCKKNVNTLNKSMYTLIMTRANKRSVAKTLRDLQVEYKTK